MEYPELERVIKVIEKLRDPKDGCPWDLKQTHQSLLKYLIEESYEFLHATEQDDVKKMEEEIADVLLQVLLHSQIASECDHFNIESVAKTLADKMIHRHPHVFEDPSKGRSQEEIIINWKVLKEQEKPNARYHMKEDYLHMPALMSSFKIGEKSTEVNFDWKKPSEVVEKVQEEWDEFQVEYKKNDKEKMHEEFGDLLFSMAQLARHLDIHPEEALRDANKKFINRFHKVEDLAKSNNVDMRSTTQETLESYWVQAKQDE